jgi:hypothetical protein
MIPFIISDKENKGNYFIPAGFHLTGGVTCLEKIYRIK